jgi:uncharacterized cupredoxin-like copper-binding protein
MPPVMSKYASMTWFAGLLFLAVPSAQAADWSKAQRVTVVTIEYVFKPANLTFHRGVAYRLHVDNRGKEMHEFTAPDFFKTLQMRNPDVTGPDHTEIVLQPGDKKDLYFVANTPGTYKLTCSDHDWLAMIGTITVVP